MRPCALLIESRDSVREDLARMLNRCGFRTLVIPPTEVDTTALTEGVDVVFIQDGNDGSPAAGAQQSVRGQYPHVPIILLSRETDLGSLIESARAGFLDVLPTPLEPLRVELSAQRAMNCIAFRKRIVLDLARDSGESDEDRIRFRGFFDSDEGGLRKLREIEDLAFVVALRQTGGNTTQAARLLGVARATFYRRMGSRMRAS